MHAVAKFEGVPELPMAIYPGAIQGHTPAELRGNVEKIFDRIVEGITRPVAAARPEEAADDAERCVFEGTLAEVNAHFLYVAGDSDDHGTMWVFRLKNRKK